MKKYFVVLAAVAMILALASGGAWAGSKTSSVSVSGTVIDVCQVSGSPALDFGTTLDAYNNSLAPNTATVTPPSIKCVLNAPVTVTDDGGLHNSGGPRLSDGTNFIPYTISYTAGLTGAGTSVDIGGTGAGNLNLSASIAQNALASVPAGVYSDTVVLTVSY